MEDREKLKKSIGTQFRIHAFTLKKDALDFAVQLLQDFDKGKRSKWMDKLVEGLRKENLSNSVVDLQALKNVATSVSKAKNDNLSVLHVFDAHTVPRWEISPDGTKMLPLPSTAEMGGDVSLATHALRQRLLLVHQRLRRNRSMAEYKISTVDCLLADSGNDEEVVMLGMLVKGQDDAYQVEDLSGCVPVEFTPSTQFHSGIFSEGSIMLFEGRWDGATLIASGVGLVPPETADETRSVIGHRNWFGGTERTAFRECPQLRALEARRSDASIAFLSDVNLDQQKTLEGVYSLLSGYSTCPPTAIVFIGNFSSHPLQPDTMARLNTGFTKLAAMLQQYRNAFTETQFIFVPGQEDPSLPLILPRPPLPPPIQGLFSQFKNCTFTTNPARIQFATQEIVVFRYDTVERLCADALSVPEELNDLGKSAARTVLSNGHLCPRLPSLQPVSWSLDCSLRLHPLPDLLVLADRFEQYSVDMAGCVVANPGPFGRLVTNFYVYNPSTRKVDASSVEI